MNWYCAWPEGAFLSRRLTLYLLQDVRRIELQHRAEPGESIDMLS